MQGDTMKFLRTGFLFLFLLPFSANAAGTYFEADYMMFTVEGDPSFLPGTYDAEPTGLGLKFGAKFSPNLAAEGLLVFGLGDDAFETSTLDVEVSTILGGYVVGNFPVSPTIDIFGKAGLAIVTYEDEDGDEIDGTGLSFGFGGAFNVGAGAIVVEYVIYPETEYDESVWGAEFTADSHSLNIGYRVNL